MLNLDFINLYVKDPAASAAFYSDLLGSAPLQSSADFAMFGTDSGVTLGLWQREFVQPPPAGAASGGVEVCFAVPDTDAVHSDWSARSIPIVQAPVTMGFGRTFVGLDPDGHRLRIYTPAAI